ncbi:GNAT family N-acetyltransferase [Phytohabitans rumicis]|uniref:N-acetyltransferase n=1 Tax=Phytohabitans rumicis TaxID=1076125 RepID=A0A6V8L6C4_9ACTN|nr:GNAT family N-acetyltransferase [Phytohabitans rumicis]GFJ89577.1 N-acetyltransferase [Phytohabitans rumicis]
MTGAEPMVVDNSAAGRFEVHVDGEVAGVALYKRRGATISFTHTEIDSRFEGRGLGSVLVRGALDAARAEGAAVLPFCPFVRSYIERHPEYLDLVPAGDRGRFDLERVQ